MGAGTVARTLRVVLDLLTVKYLLDYFASPMKLFGLLGFGATALSGLAGVATLGMKGLAGIDMTGNPLLLLTVFLGLAGLQFFSMGLLGEVAARIYYSNERRTPYTVRELVNFTSADRNVLRAA